MLNQNIAWSANQITDSRNEKYDEVVARLECLIEEWCQETKCKEIKIPDFILFAKKQLKISSESIKLNIIMLSMRNPSRYYLERISEYYTDQRRHYILCDGFIRNRILVRNV